MTQILVYNPTDFERTETVMFGCPLSVTEGELLVKYNNYQVRTARITVPQKTSGYIDLNPLPPKGTSDQAYIDIEYFLSGITTANGTEFELLRTLATNSHMHILVFKAVGPNSFSHLIVYASKGDPWIKYELLDSANLQSPEGMIPIGLKMRNPSFVDTNYIIPPTETSKKVRDMGGAPSVGCIIDLNKFNMSDLGEVMTGFALRENEMVVAGDYRMAWGPNNVPPHGHHPDRNYNPDILAHRGCLVNKRPGDTGDQWGFGYWKHLDVISQGRGDLMWHDRYATIQDSCRLSWLFEPDGTVPLSKNHPLFKSWSRTFHWAVFQSPDSFGRRERYKFNGWYEGWVTYDQEHDSSVMLKEELMLTGSYLLRLVSEMAIFHFINQVSYPSGGRALGRNIRAMIDTYLATDNTVLLEKLKLVGKQLKSTYEAINGPSTAITDNPVVLRLYNNDEHTQIPGLEWIVWEDAIAMPTIYWLANITQMPELKIIAFNVGKSVMNHGFKDDKVLKAIKWNGAQKPLGPGIALSNQTNYTEWALPCITMLSVLSSEFGDNDTLKKANELGNKIKNTSNYLNLPSYLIV